MGYDFGHGGNLEKLAKCKTKQDGDSEFVLLE
jgi:hypothetical protein